MAIKKKQRSRRRRAVKSAGFGRRKGCRFCADKKEEVDYKETKVLRHYVTETGAIVPRRVSGTCAKHQRQLCTAVKRARIVALLPFSNRAV